MHTRANDHQIVAPLQLRPPPHALFFEKSQHRAISNGEEPRI
jgi:hypothetical protein